MRRYTSTHGAVTDVAVTAAVTATMRASIAFCLASTAAAFQSAAPQAHSTALCATRMRPVWKQISDAHAIDATRRSCNCICSMAWSFYAIDATLPSQLLQLDGVEVHEGLRNNSQDTASNHCFPSLSL